MLFTVCHLLYQTGERKEDRKTTVLGTMRKAQSRSGERKGRQEPGGLRAAAALTPGACAAHGSHPRDRVRESNVKEDVNLWILN